MQRAAMHQHRENKYLMQFLAYILSITLHCALILGVYFWPTAPLVKLDQAPVLISLVDGDLGGNRAPSPILGPQGEQGQQIAPSVPKPPQKEVAPLAPETEAAPIAEPKEAPKKPEPAPIAEPKPEPEPKPEAKPEPKPDPKPEPKPKPEPEKPKPKPKPTETKKPTPKTTKKPTPKKPKVDPIKQALAKASNEVKAEAKRNAGGFGGGGGGEGEGVGGGGLGDVYMGQVMLAVRPNWDFETATRNNWVCSVRVKVDGNGNVLLARLEQSSGNAQYDASTVNAVIRTGSAGMFPAPPGPQYYDLLLVFNLAMLSM